MYRLATAEEIACAASQLEEFQDWQSVFEFAHNLYGPNVYKAQLEVDHDFDDGEEHRFLTMILAFDTDDNPMPYDFSQEFWKTPDYTGRAPVDQIEEVTKAELDRVRAFQGWRFRADTKTLIAAREEAIRQLVSDYRPELHELTFGKDFYIDEPPQTGGVVLYVQIPD